MNVLAGIIKDPMVLMDDHYSLVPDDFPERFHRIVFGALEHVIRGGAKNVDALVIDDYLQSYKDQYKVFTDNNGVAYINSVMELTSDKNFAYFYNRLKKASLLNRLSQQGFDISEYYDPTVISMTDADKTQSNLDSVSLEQILEHYEIKLGNIKDAFGESQGRHGVQSGDKMKGLKEELKEKPEIGAPMNSAKMTTICRGRRLKKFYLKVAPSGVGKAVPNYTLIPTPDQGWKRVDEIKEGDYLIGANGAPVKVLRVHPQKEPKEIWEVRFKDGRVAECCGDHLWYYRYRHEAHHGMRTSSLKTIYKEVMEGGSGYREGPGMEKGGFKFKVPLNSAVTYPEAQLPVDPYVFGLMLGDGSFRVDDSNHVFYFSSEDWELPSTLAIFMGWEYKKNSVANYTYCFYKNGKLIHVEDVIPKTHPLYNAYSVDKFIPQEYLLSSIEQRRELLRGLLDTDGHIDTPEKGRVSFSTISPRLAKDFASLVQSLGYTAVIAEDRREKYKTDVCYRVQLWCPKADKPLLFRLSRKLNVAMAYANSQKREESHRYNPIVSIVPTGRYTDMTCFTVDAPDGLFLMNDYIVTHNTRMSLADACLVSIPKRYDLERKRWVKTGCQEPTLFITTELEIEEVQTMIMAYVSGVPEEHILDGKYEPGEEARVDKAISVIQEAPLWIEHVPDFNVDDIENVIKEYKLKHQIAYCFFDYIFTSIKILTEVATKARGVKLREDNVLVMFSDRLKGICNKLNVHIDTSTQVSGDWKNAKDPDASLIRGAKGIADKVDVGYVVLEPTQKDLEAVKSILAANGQAFGQKPNLIFHVFKLRRGKLNHVKVFVHFDFSTLRTTDMFVTDRNYQLLSVDNTSVEMLLDQTDVSEEAAKTDGKATLKW